MAVFSRKSLTHIITMAWRDLRHGTSALRLFLICLILSVSVMATIGSLLTGIQQSILRDAKALLGGDIEIRQLYTPIGQMQEAHLRFTGRLTKNMEMRSMATAGSYTTLIELKSIDGAYPLVGQLETQPVGNAQDTLRYYQKLNAFGAFIDESLLGSLQVKLGDVISVGAVKLVIKGVIVKEPDRSLFAFTLGPRIMVNSSAILATKLIQPGSMVNYRYRVLLPKDTNIDQWLAELEQRFPKAGWNLRDWRSTSPGFADLFERVMLFFSLSALTTLIITGIGIACAAQHYLHSKRQSIATLKSLGASARRLYATYFAQFLIVATAGVIIALLIGVAAQFLLFHALDKVLPMKDLAGIYAAPLLLSAALGIVTTLLFGILPLVRISQIKPAELFRNHGGLPSAAIPRKPWLIIIHIVLAAIWALLAILFTQQAVITFYFIIALMLVFSVFYGLGHVVMQLARRFSQQPSLPFLMRLALRNLYQPGNATTATLLALGIGISLIVALAQVSGNLRSQISDGMPAIAPSFYLLDIQPEQMNSLAEALTAIPDVTVSSLPIIRGSIRKINDVPVDKVEIAPQAQWATRGDRGLTYAATAPANSHIVEGQWWPQDYEGEPLISFDANLARGMHIGIGDRLTVMAMGQEITGRITNLRDISWGTLEMNFSIIFSPGAMRDLPETRLATVHSKPLDETKLQQMINTAFPNLAVMRVRGILQQISALLGTMSKAVLFSGLITIFCGILVMASTVQTSLQLRRKDMVMLKVLGVTRLRLMHLHLIEFSILAMAVAGIAAIIGLSAAYGVLQLMRFFSFVLQPAVLLLTLAGGLCVAISLGLIATHKALSIRPLSILRNE